MRHDHSAHMAHDHHWLEMRSISQAQGALGELAKLLPDVATRVRGTGASELLEEVTVDQLRDGDLVLVRPGASVPVDGDALTTGSAPPGTGRAPGFLFSAVPVMVRGMGTFPVRAWARVER